MDDIVESAKPPRSPRPHGPDDAERRKSLLLHTVALALVAIAVSTGIIAWETHQERVFNKAVYCGFNTTDVESDPEMTSLADQIGC